MKLSVFYLWLVGGLLEVLRVKGYIRHDSVVWKTRISASSRQFLVHHHRSSSLHFMLRFSENKVEHNDFNESKKAFNAIIQHDLASNSAPRPESHCPSVYPLDVFTIAFLSLLISLFSLSDDALIVLSVPLLTYAYLSWQHSTEFSSPVASLLTSLGGAALKIFVTAYSFFSPHDRLENRLLGEEQTAKISTNTVASPLETSALTKCLSDMNSDEERNELHDTRSL
ncbi:hypothetical protein EON65_44195, partial [archaeon]